MKPLWTVLTIALLLFGAGILVGEVIVSAQDSVLPPGQQPVITEPFPRSQIITTYIPPQRIAVDLYVLELDGRFHPAILWSTGDITFPHRSLLDHPLGKLGDCPADINGDGKVGVADLVILNAAWGTDCP